MPNDALSPLPSPEEVQLYLSKHHSANNVIQSAIHRNKNDSIDFRAHRSFVRGASEQHMFLFNIWDATCNFFGLMMMTHI